MLFWANNISLPKDDTFQWMVLSVGILATVYLVMRPKFRRKRDPMEQHAPMLSLAQQRQIERDLNRLMVEMLETARQMTAQLDTRAARLEILLREADDKLAALSLAAGKPAQTPPSEGPLQVLIPTPPAEPQPARDDDPIPPEPRHAEVYAMADNGQSALEIARHLGRPSGEVELILALRRH